VAFDPVVERPAADLASRIVWFDAFVSNVDRTVRNTNLLMWHRRLWLIDHGASLYFHHAPGWEANPGRARDPFALIKQHVLLPLADALEAVDAALAARLTPALIQELVALVPDSWLSDDGSPADAGREAYARYLGERLAAPRAFVAEALRVR
jgi:hypothetical protein